jgi:hypothetical protein
MPLPIASSWLGFTVFWTRWNRIYPVMTKKPGQKLFEENSDRLAQKRAKA